MKLLFVFVFIYLGIAQGEYDSKIIGGLLLHDSTKYPSHCSVRSVTLFECACTIINDYYVLTAASCVKGFVSGGLSVKVGTTHINSGGQNYEIFNEGLLHPDFIEDVPSTPDLAILTLKFPFVWTSSVQPVKLPTQGQIIPALSSGVILGWGFSADVGPESAVLKEGNVTVIDNLICQDTYSNIIIDPFKVCTDATLTNIRYCNKDDGGPLYINGELIGVIPKARATTGLCSEENIQIFTNIANYIDWINDNTIIPPPSLMK